MERILTDNIMNDKKICFIICYNDDKYISECMYYINRLVVPAGYTIDVLTVKYADSMTSGYNAAMNETDAKYKIYMHQDVFIVNINLLEDIIKIFEDKNILLVTHGVALATLLNNIKKAPLSELWAGSIHKNCAVTEVEIKDGEMQILSENQVYYEDEVPDWAR